MQDLAAQKQLQVEEIPQKPRMAKPWENPGLREKKTLSGSSRIEQSGNATTTTSFPHSTQAASRDPAKNPQKDDLRTDYHIKSGLASKFCTSEDHHAHMPSDMQPPTLKTSDMPWEPFRSYSEFEFAEVALDAALNKKQIEKLLKIIQRCIKGEDGFGLKSHKDLTSIWIDASVMVSPFTRYELTAINGEYETTFDFWCRSLWDWVLDLVENPSLARYFEWDAQKLYKYDGKKFFRFIHEPWTAARFWEVQSLLPSQEGKPIAIILYADKTKLSSFGTEMGYPIIARLGNLPAEIRNGRGVGGGCVIGWLPILVDDEEEKGKKDYIDFKRVVWHDSFRKLLETVREHSHLGFWVKCGDGITRHLFPMILILSADYEEQYVFKFASVM